MRIRVCATLGRCRRFLGSSGDCELNERENERERGREREREILLSSLTFAGLGAAVESDMYILYIYICINIYVCV